ncbi:putative ribonuclease H-like domain-containing protein [Tanacetum coccineum]
MRPFGCPMTILNTLDPLGKFDEKADDAFFVGYFINRKAFRVFNIRTSKVEENLHINFLKNKPNVAGSKPDWLFDVDLLTNSMNYELVTAENQTNKNAGIKDNVDAVPTQQYILLPLLYDSPQSSKDAVADDTGKKTNEEPINKGERNGQEKEGGANKENDHNVQDFRAELDNLLVQRKEGYANSTNRDSTVSPSVSTARQNFTNADDLPTDPLIPDLEDTGNHYECKRAIGTKWVYRNKKDKRGIVVRNKARLVAQSYTQEEGIDYDESAFLYVTIEEEVYVCQPLGFKDPQFPNKMMHKRFQMSSIGELTFFLGLKVQQNEDGIFISQDKYVADILKKFDFTTVKAASTLIETNKALNKDEEAEDVDVHLYRSMIASLMYLTASRPDITFAVCACARFQVTPKVSHLHAVKRIFRYLKGQPKLGLWYLRDSPFNLEAFSNSDYAGASLDRKIPQQEVFTTVLLKLPSLKNLAEPFNDTYETPKHTQNVLANMRRKGKGFSRIVTPLFQSMLVPQVVEGKGSGQPSEPQPPSSTAHPSQEEQVLAVVTSHPQKTQTPRQAKRGRDTEIPQSGGPLEKVGDEAVHKELGDRVERAATTAASLDAEHDSGNILKDQSNRQYLM